jgi:predicted ATPase
VRPRSTRTLIETGALVGDPGRHRLTRSVTAIDIPPTVQAILAARIDRLSAAVKPLLQGGEAT